MFYLNVSGSANPYSHTPLKAVRTLSETTLAEIQQHLPYFAECLHPSSGYSCIHTVIMEVNDDTGEVTIHHNHMGKNPLKVRKEINKRTVDVSSAGRKVSVNAAALIFDDLVVATPYSEEQHL